MQIDLTKTRKEVPVPDLLPPTSDPEDYVEPEEDTVGEEAWEMGNEETPDADEPSVTLFADPHDADLAIEFAVYYFVDDPGNVILVTPDDGQEMSTPIKSIGGIVETSIMKAIAFNRTIVRR